MMKLSCALVACNDNPKYLDFWPLVREAWWEIVGIPAVMIYIGETKPDKYKDDPSILCFPPIEGWSTITQSQVIRLLYPSLLQCDGAVITSDMDMIPLQREFFVEGVDKFQDHQFVSLRGIDEREKQIYMCYCAATPQTWSDLFQIKTVDDIRKRMTEWQQQMNLQVLEHGGPGWCFDQMKLYEHVQGWLQQFPERIGMLPWTATISRLDRANPYDWIPGNEMLAIRIQEKDYIDFHMPSMELFSNILSEILLLAKQVYTR